ncbi:MAG: penicillin-binding protein 2, partial [Actinobacteria bacterium]|nr:penicillin-binding protein 2 [Actinomycetota bacterium]
MAKSKSGDRRLAVVAIVLVLGLAVVAGKLALLQGIQAEHYKELASDQRDTHIQITPRRGTVFDREGEILAISEDVTTVYATPYQIKNPEAAAKGIAEVLGEDPEDVQDKLDSNSGFVYLARKLDKTLANRIKEMDIEGVGFVDESKRFYPMGEFASQVLGVVDIDNKGQAGLELYYEDTLGGKPGEVLLERDAVGNPIPGSEKRRVQAVDGVDLQLTIDKDIQACVEESLGGAVDRHGARAGTAVVLDCNTGDILAMATSPGFDPNDRAMVEPEAMRNRAVTDVYEPGSVLKVVTAVGALEEGVVEPNSVIQVPSQLQVADEVFTDAEPMPSRALEFKKV